MGKLVNLIPHGITPLPVVMSESVDRYACAEINIFLSVGIVKISALTVVKYQVEPVVNMHELRVRLVHIFLFIHDLFPSVSLIPLDLLAVISFFML